MHSNLLITPIDCETSDIPYLAVAGSGVFWQVATPDRRLSNFCRPFSASDSKLVLHECPECGFCGVPSIAVRRYLDSVVWVPIPRDGYAPGEILYPEGFVQFLATDYERALSAGCTRDLPPLRIDDPKIWFPKIKPPDPDSVLYRLPESRLDPTGRLLIVRLKEALNSNSKLRLLDQPPHRVFTLRLGLNVDGYPEAVWRIGRAEKHVAMLFEGSPCFPFWITSERITELFDPVVGELAQESRQSELSST